MGIPFFARFLARSLTTNVMCAPPAAHGSDGIVHSDRVFIDFNGTIHEAARDVMMTRMADEQQSDELEACIMQEAVDRLVQRAQLLAPSTLLFVAIDGVPPRAKMQQQRYRRFASTWIKESLRDQRKPTSLPSSIKPNWDTNAITPGTRFLTRMNAYLKAHQDEIRDRIGVADVLISGPDEDGEGEQKIFKFLRDNLPTGTSVDLVYGMDADLILQALLYVDSTALHHSSGLWVVREEDKQSDTHHTTRPPTFAFIDARRLMAGILHKYKCTAGDFALLCVLIGNDFVPRLPSINVQDGGIDVLMDARLTILSEEKDPTKSIVDASTGTIDMHLLTRVVETLAMAESSAMDKAEQRHQAAVRRIKTSRTAATVTEDLPLMFPFPDVIQPSRPGWRPRYHHHVMHLDGGADGASELSTVCRTYLQGVIWSFRYTAQVCLSKAWHYPFIAAPTATDLHNFMLCHPDARNVEAALSRLDEEEMRDELILDPVLQLLAVLPPQSAHLLPNDETRALMTDVRRGVMHMYPVAFDFSKYLKYKTWECHPILPRVDVVALKQRLVA